MKWHVVVPVTLASACGLVALTLGVVHDELTPRTLLLIIYLVSACVLGILTGLIIWGVEAVQDEIRASAAIMRTQHARIDDDTNPRIRSVRT